MVIVAVITATAAAPASAQKKSIVIGLDGFGFGDKGFDVVHTPRMDSLIDGSWAAGFNGAYSSEAFAGGELGGPSQQPTVSGPGWTSMVTGVWANKHNVYDNSFTNPDVARHPACLGFRAGDHVDGICGNCRTGLPVQATRITRGERPLDQTGGYGWEGFRRSMVSRS